MINHILSLTKKLIAIESVGYRKNKEKIEILKLIEKELHGFIFVPFVSEGTPSLLYTNNPKEKKRFKILLNAHLDVVPGKPHQYKPYEKDGRLYGRGAYDMKAAAATMIIIFKELASKLPYTLGLQLVTDEETGGEHGVKRHIEKGVTSEFVLGGECSAPLKINHEAKGIRLITITTKGRPAHSAYLWHGENAAVKMAHGIQKLHEIFPVPDRETWETTASVIKIETGNPTINTVPDACTALVNIRDIPEDKRDFVKVFKTCFPEDTEIVQTFLAPPEYTDMNDPFVQILQQAITKITNKPAEFVKTHAQSDMRYYHTRGIPAVNFGPVGGGQHGDEEWIDIKSLETYATILKNFLLSVK